MNYRKADSEDIYSLEYVFTNILNIDVEYKKNVHCYSNQETLCQLFFHCKSCTFSGTTDDELSNFVSSSIFTDEYISALISAYYDIKSHTNYLSSINSGDIRILLAILSGNKSDEFKTNYSQLLTKGFERNSKRKSQDNNIRIILSNIDYGKLSDYINSLILDIKTDEAEQKITELRLYIEKIFAKNEKLVHLCKKFHLTKDCNRLALILLYSLFSDENFDIYITNNFVINSALHRLDNLVINDSENDFNAITDNQTINSSKFDSSEFNSNEFDSNESDNSKFNDGNKSISYEYVDNSFDNHSEADSSGNFSNNRKYYHSSTDDYNENFFVKHIDLFNKIITYLLVVISSLQFASLCYPFVSNRNWTTYKNTSFALYSIILLSVSSCLLVLRYIAFIFAEKSAKYTIFKTSTVMKTDIRFNHTTLKNRRLMNHRFVTCSIVTLLIFISIGISVAACSFPLLVSCIMMISIIFVYIDAISENIYCAKYYDRIHLTDKDVPSYGKGLARLYKGDFDTKSNQFICKPFTKNEKYSDECISYIYMLLAERLNNTWIVTNVILIILNLVTLALCIVHFIYPLNSYFKIDSQLFFDYCSIFLILVTGIINIVLLLYSDTHYKHTLAFKHLSQALHFGSATSNELLDYFYIMSFVKDIDIVRGIYCYNYAKFEKNVLIDEIIDSDRMHFSYRKLLRSNRLNICSVLLVLSAFCIVSWNFKHYRFLIVVPFLLIFFPLFTNFVVNKIDELLMKKMIRYFFRMIQLHRNQSQNERLN